MATVTSVSLPPTKQPSVIAVDVGTKRNERTGGYNIVGGRIKRGSQSGSVTAEQLDKLIKQQEAQRKAQEQAKIEAEAKAEAQRQAQQQAQVEAQQRQQATIVQAKASQQQESFYYRSESYVNSPYFAKAGYTQGPVFYETTSEGKVVRIIPSEEAREYNLSPTKDVIAKTPEAKESFRERVARVTATAQTKIVRGGGGVSTRVALFGAGVVSSLQEQVEGVKAILNPKTTIPTIKSIPSSVIAELKSTGTSVKLGYPEYAGGRLSGFYVGTKGIEYVAKVPVKITDVYRTRSAIEIPTERIVAPEYFAGQTYPKIKTGQTAGQLLSEFPTKEVYGVTQLKGFTASPSPINAKLGVQAGSSELAGLYQAPKLSPQFLRLTAGEKTVFSFSPFETFRPSASIVKPTSFDLTPVIKSSQRNLASLKPTQKFFDTKATLGKSYVPFVKTEKEAVIPAGTPLVLTSNPPRFYFKFENRRIPIYEFEALPNELTSKRVFTLREVNSLSSRRVGGRARFSSLDVVKASRSSSATANRPSVSYSVTSLSSTYPSVSTGYSRGSPSRSIPSYVISSKSYGRISPPLSPSYYPPYSPVPSIPKTVKTFRRGSDITPKNILKPVKLFVREKGEFKFRGVFKTGSKALERGVDITQKTINRSFKIVGANAGLPTGYRFSRKKGQQNVFVELSKTSLSQTGEQFTIQSKRRKRR